MLKVLFGSALFLICATQAAIGTLSEETPAEFANRFYRAYGALRVRGVPNEKQRRALSPFLSPGLLALCAKAERAPSATERGKAAGSMWPRFKAGGCAGDFFTSNTAGCAATYSIAFPQPAIGRLILPIHLADPDTGDAWVDELVLHQHDGGWIIADIRFTRDRQNRLFGKGSLRRELNDCIRRRRNQAQSAH